VDEQRHIIKKQIIELRLNSQAEAFELQNKVSEIFQCKILPLLETCCNQLSSADEIHRIDKLEVDLGDIDLNALEAELIEKFVPAFRQKLARKLDRSESLSNPASTQRAYAVASSLVTHFEASNVHPVTDFSGQKWSVAQPDSKRAGTQLELLSYFIQTGLLPWWASRLNQQELEANFERLFSIAPNDLKTLFFLQLKKQKYLKRIIYQFSDRILIKIAALFVPKISDSIEQYSEDLQAIYPQVVALKAIEPARFRLQYWQGIFLNLSQTKPALVGLEQLIEANLLHIATSFKLNYRSLINQMRNVVGWSQSEHRFPVSQLPEILNKIAIDLNPNPDRLRVEDPNFEAKSPFKGFALDDPNDRLDSSVDRSALDTLDDEFNPIEIQAGLTRFFQAFNPQKSLNEILKILQNLEAELDVSSSLTGQNRVLLDFVRSHLPLLSRLQQRWHQIDRAEMGLEIVPTLNQIRTEFSTELEKIKVQDNTPTVLQAIQTVATELEKFYQWNQQQRNQQQQNQQQRNQQQQNQQQQNQQQHSRFVASPQSIEQSVEEGQNEETMDEPLPIPESSILDPRSEVIQDWISPFSFSDEIYIDNAGLVILWPFLDRFLQKIDFIQQGQFPDLLVAHKAVLLLQYLVEGSLAAPEHLLALNKLLCGLDILDPIEANLDLAATMTDSLQTECDNLLMAVIVNWAILKSTSAEGLQRAFLQRQGILRVANGSWLLQVERQTYDVLLDQLPWTIRAIKLPWMTDVLYVEW